MHKRTFLPTAILTIAGFWATPALGLNLIINGGFEVPFIGHWAQAYPAGSDEITGWTIVDGSVDIVASDYWPPFEGLQSLDLNGVSLGTIEQAFPTVPGETYWLSFVYADNVYSPYPPSAEVGVFGGDASTILSHGISHWGSTLQNMNYRGFLRSFEANSTTSRLRFRSTGGAAAHGIALDAIRVSTEPVNPIPEPASLVLLGVGFLGLAGQLRRRS